MKKVLISIVVIVLLGAGIVVFYFDSVVKSGIEVVGTRLLGTDVTVSSVSISPLDGTGVLRGLSIRNPEGFNEDYAFQLDEVSIALDPASVFSNEVLVDSVIVVQPHITYETRLTTDNIRTLLANLPDPGDDASGDQGSSDRGLVIRQFRMLEPQLDLVAAIGTAQVTLPAIELNNIGAGSQSSTAADVLREILSSLRRAILQANLPALDDFRSELEGRLQQGVDEVENALEESVDDAVEDLGNRLRRILN